MRRFSIVLVALTCVACEASFRDLRPADDDDPTNVMAADMGDGNADADPNAMPNGDPNGDPNADPNADPAVETVVATGGFERVRYDATGSASLVELADGSYEVRLSSDFSTDNVPGPVVVLASVDSLGTAIDSGRGDIELGPLTNLSGASTFAVPGDPGDRRYVWIYCKPFGVEMSFSLMEDQ